MELTFDDYVKAARVIAECSKERLPLVVDILAQSGINMEQAKDIARVANMTQSVNLKERRKYETKKPWAESENEVVLMLRNEFDSGTNFSMLSRLCGISRVTLYKYLWGERNPKPYNAKIIKSVLANLNSEATDDN